MNSHPPPEARFAQTREIVMAALLAASLLLWHGGWRWPSFVSCMAAAVLMWRLGAPRAGAWYAATVMFPLPQALLVTRIAMADLFALPLVGRQATVVARGGRPVVASSLTVPLLCLLALFGMATVVGYLRTGRMSFWALLNKDVGILVLVAVLVGLTVTMRTLDDVKRIARWFIGGVAIANLTSLIAVAAAFAGYENDLYLIGNGRLYGWMGNPSINGGFLFTAGMIEMGLLMEPSKAGERRAWRWVNIWLLAVGLGFTLSRSTWLSVAAASATLLIATAVHASRTREFRFTHAAAVSVWMILPVLVLGNIVRARGGIEVTAPETVAAQLQARLVNQCVTNPALDVCAQVQMPTAPPITPLMPAAVGTAALAPPPVELSAEPIVASGASSPSPGGVSDVASREPITRNGPALRTSPLTKSPATEGGQSSAEAAKAAASPPADASGPDLAGPLMNARGLNDRVAIASVALTQYRGDAATMMFGIGLGTFFATSGAAFGVPLVIHNTFIWFLVEFGPLGLLVVLWIWGRTIAGLWRAAFARNGGEYLACGAMAALAGMTMFCILNEGFYQRQLWLVFAMADRLHALAVMRGTVPTVASAAPPSVVVA